MFNKIINGIKGALAKMGLINSIESLSDHPLLANNSDYIQIERWKNIYKGKPDWINYEWVDVIGDVHNDEMNSLNMPKIAAKKMATIVFNSKMQINITNKNESKPKETSPEDYDNEPNKFVHKVLSDNYFYNNCQRYLEYMFGTGGMVIRLYVDDKNKVKIRFATADSFIPISQDANGVTECVIADQFVRKGKHYTLLEWHTEDNEYYHIKNELFESTDNTDNDIGHKVALSTVFDNLKEKSDYSKKDYSLPTFVYIKPNIANNINMKSPLGVPIYAYAADTLRQLDKAYDMLYQEMVMGKRRVVVPDYMLKPVTDNITGTVKRVFDTNDRAYQQFKGDDTKTEGIKDLTLPLRNQDIMATIQGLLDYYAVQCGFSSGTFSFENGGLKTATEVVSQNSETFQSKSAHETILDDAFKKVVQIILELGKNSDANYSDTTDVDIAIQFDDSISKDRDENLKFFQTAVGNQPLMSHLEAIKQFNGITDKEAAIIKQQIDKENPTSGLDTDMKDIIGSDE